MNDARGLELIARQIERDGRSLLQYVGEAFPYTPAASEAARDQVAALARAEQAAIGKLIRFLHRHHVTPPLLGAFLSSFTTINFVSLEHLLPALQRELQQSIAELERELATLPESAARHVLWDYLEMKRRHLATLPSAAPAAARA